MISMDQIKTEQIKTVCVYCGSGPGSSPRFVEAALALGKIFAENNIRLVYGGGSVGLMGAVAKATLDHGGLVTGIIPDFLRSREHMLSRVQEMIVTPDMHERKRLMFEHSDAVAVGIDDEGGVILDAVMRPNSGRAVGSAAGAERCGVERIDIVGCFGAQADVRAALGRHRRHAGAQVDPEFGIGFAEADRG